MVERLLSIKPELVQSIHLVKQWTPLHHASHEGLDELVETLVRKYGAKVDSVDDCEGRTPLMLACVKGHKRVIERLLLAGANANISSQLDGNTALHTLAEIKGNHVELVKLLLPFSKASLSVKNLQGLLPYELA